MLELDQMLDGLTVEVQPFAICEARGDGAIDLGVRDRATLHYVLCGAGTFTTPGVPDIQSRGGTILITPAHDNHRLKAKADASCEVFSCTPVGRDWQTLKAGEGRNGVIVACSEIALGYRGIEGLFDYLQAPLICHLDESDGLKMALEQILREFAEPQAGSRSLVRVLMQQCMIHILRQVSASAPEQLHWLTAANDPRLWRALTAIFDHPEAPHTLETLAETAQMSRSSFAAKFKQVLGRGPIDLLKHARLQLAARLLISSERSVKTITRDVGYGSRSYFSRAFQDRFGLSPAGYRDSHNRFYGASAP